MLRESFVFFCSQSSALHLRTWEFGTMQEAASPVACMCSNCLNYPDIRSYSGTAHFTWTQLHKTPRVISTWSGLYLNTALIQRGPVHKDCACVQWDLQLLLYTYELPITWHTWAWLKSVRPPICHRQQLILPHAELGIFKKWNRCLHWIFPRMHTYCATPFVFIKTCGLPSALSSAQLGNQSDPIKSCSVFPYESASSYAHIPLDNAESQQCVYRETFLHIHFPVLIHASLLACSDCTHSW